MLAASISRLASRASAIRRSEEVIPRSLAESNAMLSWRGAADSTAGAEFFMLLLLDDGRIVPGASSETALDQQLMQLSQCRQLDARRAERGEATLDEAAAALTISQSTIRRLITEGALPASQHCKGAPWIIRQADLERDEIRRLADLRRLRRPPPDERQQNLFAVSMT